MISIESAASPLAPPDELDFDDDDFSQRIPDGDEGSDNFWLKIGIIGASIAAMVFAIVGACCMVYPLKAPVGKKKKDVCYVDGDSTKGTIDCPQERDSLIRWGMGVGY